MFHMPMSSPMMTTMLGGLALLACACRVALPPAKTLETASAPSVNFRTPAPKSILLLFDRSRLVSAGRVLLRLPVHYGYECLGTVTCDRWGFELTDNGQHTGGPERPPALGIFRLIRVLFPHGFLDLRLHRIEAEASALQGRSLQCL